MPITPDDDPKLKKLDSELKAARAEYEKDYNPKPDPNDENVGIGARAGVDGIRHGGLACATQARANPQEGTRQERHPKQTHHQSQRGPWISQ